MKELNDKEMQAFCVLLNRKVLDEISKFLDENDMDEQEVAGYVLNSLASASGYYLFLGSQSPDHFYEGVTAYTKSLTSYGKQYFKAFKEANDSV